MKQRKTNKPTSNDMMEQEFAILEQLPSLKPPQALYGKIMSKIENSGHLSISRRWLHAAAAIFAIVLCVEVFILMQANQQPANDVEVLIEQTNNKLYYE